MNDDLLKQLDASHLALSKACGNDWAIAILVARMNAETAHFVVQNKVLKISLGYPSIDEPERCWPKNRYITHDKYEVWVNGFTNTTQPIVIDESIAYGKLLLSVWSLKTGMYLPISI